MNPIVLRAHIGPLPEYLPRTKAMESQLQVDVGFDDAWYRSQKEHWLGWLGEYAGPGAYGRKPDPTRDSAYVYNHIQCAPMLFWLSEAIGASDMTLERAFGAVTQADTKGASQCAALRKILPWHDVARALASYNYSRLQRPRIQISAFGF